MKLILLLLLMIPWFNLNGQSNPVIIELFTSQGCSSCPAADKNLTDILNKSAGEGTNVYGLSFHVDYWNYIGWKDPYSSKEFTERQRNYANIMKLQSIYTPQMIINGKYEFVGSNRNEAEKLIKQSLTEKPIYQVSITNFTLRDNILIFNYTIDKEPEGEQLNIAVVERKVENDVPRGENSGRKLHHDNVVRKFKTMTVQREGTIQMEVPPIDNTNASLILYIRNKQLLVVGAIAKPF